MNIDLAKITERFNDSNGKLVLGIDGYIDSVWQILASRASLDEYVLYDKMGHFSQTLVSCDDGGFSHEIIRKRRSFGGFTAHTAEATVGLGVNTSMLGMFGKNTIDPVFDIFSGCRELISLGDPALSIIFEFTDGKIMLIHLDEIMSFNWKSLTEAVDEVRIKDIYNSADIIGLGYWSLIPAFDEFAINICRLIKDNPKKQRMFFDFADIRKRDKASLENTLGLLAELNKQIPMTLSLNENEAELLFSYFGETFTLKEEGADTQTERVRKTIGLDELVVHTPYFATAASESEGCFVMRQNYCTSPIITTGAGDNFSGGYLAAALKGLSAAERLVIGNVVTYLYISRGKSPGKDEMLDELGLWYG